MKKRILIAFAPLLFAGMCSAGNQCERVGLIAVAPANGEVETAANRFDTDATVRRIRLHNDAISKVCGALPTPANG